jgi:hypothetical protein
MLLLGITAMSLLTTPLVILSAIHLLIREGQHQLYISGPRYRLSTATSAGSNDGSANGRSGLTPHDSSDWGLPSHHHGGGSGSSSALLAAGNLSNREHKELGRAAAGASRGGR